MVLPDLYPAQVGSPYTTLAAPYTSGEGTMTLVDATKLPTAPNIVCLAGDVAGEFSYTGKSGNVLQGVVALPGTPVATTWSTGAFAFRGISAYDLNALTDYVTRGPVSIDDLQYPLYIAHRGGSHLWPENTMYAIEGAMSLGCQAIETDVRVLADGALAVMHNATIDSMSSLTGNVAAQASMNWRSLPIDCSSWFGTEPFPDTTPLLIEDILRKFGGKVVFFFDVKEVAAIQPLTDLIVRYGLERCCVIIASLAALTIPHTAGIPVAVIGDAVDPTAAASAGVQWCVMSAGATESYVASMVGAGIKPLVYTLNRHHDRDKWLALGVEGFFSDDPIYMSGTHRKLTSDPFGIGTYYHGHLTTRHLSNDGGAVEFADTFTRGSFTSGRWGFPNTSTTVMFYDTLQGWACPIVDLSYRIAATVTLDTLDIVSRWASIGFGWADDRLSPEWGGGINGYRVLVRGEGAVDLYKFVNGVATQLGSIPTAPIDAGGSATIQIDVSPTEIVVTRTDVVDATATYADTTFRGQYASLGVAVGSLGPTGGAGATFSGVSVTPIV